MNTDDLKEEIIKSCTTYYDSGVIKNIISKPQVSETTEMYNPNKKLNYQGGVALGPFVQYHLFILFIIVLGVSIVISYQIDKTDKLGKTFLISFAILYAVGYLIYRNIKSLQQEIKIDKYGISLNGSEFEWKEVYKTFVLTTPSYQGASISSLIIVGNDQNILQYDIGNISCSKIMLANLIEYYKAKNAGLNN